MATNNKQAPITTYTDEYAVDLQSSIKGAQRGAQFFRPKEGNNLIRILPTRGSPRFYLTASQHFIRRPGSVKVIYCAQEAEIGRCYVCELVQELQSTGLPPDKAEADALTPRLAYFCPIIAYAEPDKRVQVYSFGVKTMRPITQALTLMDAARTANEQEALAQGLPFDPRPWNPFHPEFGRDWTVTKTNLGGGVTNVDYTVIVGMSPEPIRRKIPSFDPSWLDTVPDMMAAIVEYKTYDEQKELFSYAPPRANPQDPEVAAMQAAPVQAALPMHAAPVVNPPTPIRPIDPTPGPLGEPGLFCASAECGAPVQANWKACPACGTVIGDGPVPLPAPVAGSADRPLTPAELRAQMASI